MKKKKREKKKIDHRKNKKEKKWPVWLLPVFLILLALLAVPFITEPLCYQLLDMEQPLWKCENTPPVIVLTKPLESTTIYDNESVKVCLYLFDEDSGIEYEDLLITIFKEESIVAQQDYTRCSFLGWGTVHRSIWFHCSGIPPQPSGNYQVLIMAKDRMGNQGVKVGSFYVRQSNRSSS